jgi:hypothetical protein
MKRIIKKIIWEDLEQKPGILEHSTLFGISLIFIVLSIISSLIQSSNYLSFGLLILAVIFTLHFVLGMRLRYLSIKQTGIWTGNNTSGQMLDKLVILKQKNTFLKWGDISKIELAEKLYSVSYAGGKKPFIIIHLKNKEDYECLIADYEGFIQALIKLNKDYLLKDKNGLYKKFNIK